MKLVSALVAGLLFGSGLVISGLANPAKVLNFLDITGAWDPSLALVMAAAVVVTAIGYRLVLQRPAPAFEPNFQLPSSKTIDKSLIAGSALFGIGWGLGGFCPGPALVALSQGGASTIAFLAAMIIGVWAARLLAQTPSARAPAAR